MPTSASNNLSLISVMRRQAKVFAACCLAITAVGALYVLTATPLYTASANIIIDNRAVRAVHDISTLSDAVGSDATAIVESQAEVLRSEKVGLSVIKNLNLSLEDPAFTKPAWIYKVWASCVVKIDAIIGAARPLNDAALDLKRQLKVLKRLNSNLHISRVGRTFVLQVDYTSPDPSRAAEIANAYTNAYILEQLNSGVQAMRRAESWLQQRTEELRQLSADADLAVQKFKADHNLLATKGALLSEQQLNEMTTQLVPDQAQLAQARARYLSIKNIIDTRQSDSVVVESLNNLVVNNLRTKYLDAAARKIGLERKFGPDHVVVVELKHQIEDLKALMFQELSRIAETYRSDYEVAAAREKALAENLAQQKALAVAANDAQVQLRQLQQKSESYTKLYQTFVKRFQEAAQQESFPLADAHVISAASPPIVPSHPRTPLVLAISLTLGILAGVCVANFRESTDYVFRTVEQVRAELGVDVLGLIPIVSRASSPKYVPDNVPPIMRYAIDNPFSTFAETLRSAKVAANLVLSDRSPKIIGLVSLLPNEGKSTVAKNFASLLAKQGAKTLLVDADMRNPTHKPAMGCERRQDSQSESSALPPLAEFHRYESDTSLQLLPCIYATEDPHSAAEGLSPATFDALLRSSGQAFEYIVIDLPPIGPVVSARWMAPTIDAFIFVIEWGTTSRGAVRAALEKEHLIRDKLLGVILNKVDLKKLMIYEHFGSDGYYNRLYENYYKRTETV